MQGRFSTPLGRAVVGMPVGSIGGAAATVLKNIAMVEARVASVWRSMLKTDVAHGIQSIESCS